MKLEEFSDLADLDRCILMVDGWYTSQKQPAADRRHEVRVSHNSTNLDQDEYYMTDYLASDLARRVEKLMGPVMQTGSFDCFEPNDGVLVRNYIMITLGMSNSQRSGAIINITVCEYRAAIHTGDTYTILVNNHKTFTTHSYARLVMNLNTYQMMSTYFEHIRPCYRGKNATETMTPLFLTKQGEQLSNSQFDKVVKRMTGRDISLTKNRKQSVTNRKRSGASELNNLAEHMTHSVNTQKGYYGRWRSSRVWRPSAPPSAPLMPGA